MRNLIVASGFALCGFNLIAQPVQWRAEDGGNGHWYQGIRSDTALSWTQARHAANQIGGDLVSITSPGEAAFVAGYAAPLAPLWQNTYGGPWIGAYQDVTATDYSEPSGGWRWASGEPWGYTNWDSIEPNNGNPFPEHAAILVRTDGRWGDFSDTSTCLPGYNCGQTWAYLIEWSADCNGDGIVDKGQILAGDLSDEDGNGLPDGVAITSQPVDQSLYAGSAALFTVEVSTVSVCNRPVEYQWQRRNPVIADPNAPGAWINLTDGGGFVNTNTAALGIQYPNPAIATGYRCRISGGCGCSPIYTEVVNFSVNCPADFDGNGGVDGGDLAAFFEHFEAGC